MYDDPPVAEAVATLLISPLSSWLGLPPAAVDCCGVINWGILAHGPHTNTSLYEGMVCVYVKYSSGYVHPFKMSCSGLICPWMSRDCLSFCESVWISWHILVHWGLRLSHSFLMLWCILWSQKRCALTPHSSKTPWPQVSELGFLGLWPVFASQPVVFKEYSVPPASLFSAPFSACPSSCCSLLEVPWELLPATVVLNGWIWS